MGMLAKANNVFNPCPAIRGMQQAGRLPALRRAVRGRRAEAVREPAKRRQPRVARPGGVPSTSPAVPGQMGQTPCCGIPREVVARQWIPVRAGAALRSEAGPRISSLRMRGVQGLTPFPCSRSPVFREEWNTPKTEESGTAAMDGTRMTFRSRCRHTSDSSHPSKAGFCSGWRTRPDTEPEESRRGTPAGEGRAQAGYGIMHMGSNPSI